MAKMKVYDIARELDKQSKEIVAFLQDKGFEVKAAQSSIDDDAVELVRKHFGSGDVENAKNAAKSEKTAETESKAAQADDKQDAAQAKAQSSRMENAQPAADNKQSGTENKQAKAENNKTDENKQSKPADEPKKKKKIIFVSNPHNSKMTKGKPAQGSPDRRPAGAGNNQKPQQPEHHTIIRPTHKPTPVTAEPYDVRQKQQQERQLERRQQEKLERENREKENALNKKAVPEKPNRGINNNENRKVEKQNPQANNGSQSGNRSAQPMADNGRNFNNNDRSQRRNGGADNRFKKGGNNKDFMPESPIKDNEKHRDEEKRRISQEKDKRSRKDLIYEEDDVNIKNRNKAGRFIKPEKKVETVVEEQIKVITLPESLTIRELADKMKIQPSVIVKKLFMQGQIVTVNSEISFEDAENIAIEYEIICEKEVKVDVIEELLKEEEEDESKMVPRPPVICVMGHVDHGKTSLLDAIRKTNVTDKEAGGITQAIGAYTVKANNQKITFLDTPGHEAFTAMRMRGANSTDIAVLVVAADDGVMPQTIEAINHAKAAGIEIIVAVNKIDKPNANIDRVKQEMTEYELIPSDWGGSTEFVPVSAKSGEGIGTLLETILLTAEILELKANPNRRARGLVIEAELDKGRGPVATVLVQKGTLHVGDFISAGASHGKVRAMIDDKGRRVKEALPSMPVEILGLSDVPSAGEVFIVHENDKSAKSYADTYMSQHKEEMIADTKSRMSLDDLFNQIQEGNLKELNLIVKADVQGSVEAVKQSLMKLSNDEIVVKCIHGGVGAITESDVTLASASSAIIIGFNVRPDATAKSIAEREGVDVRLYKVIYQAIEDIEAAMKGMLDPIYEEKIIGHAEVRQIFKASAIGNIAGSYVLDGEFQRGCKIRISREGEQIYEGNLASLKRFKDDVKEVKAGFECGLVFEGFDQMKELDIIEAYIMVEVPRT
ncbi:MAG: translation initiation factor IF-2 [Lachnospiraceae bacterium]|nr:translation initiation factor IF-2 [Lachnospiraceae bacterium]